MKIVFKNPKNTPLNLMRQAGYSFERKDPKTEEESFVRHLSTEEYPKIHAFIKKQGEEIIINLHLDQKKPSYPGSYAHAAEYESEILEKEAKNIREIFKS